MTKGEFIFETSRAIGLDDTAGSDELILMQRWLKRGVIDVLTRTHCYVDIGTTVLQAGVTDYRTDSSILAVENITAPDTTGNPVELDVVSMTEIMPWLSPSIAASATPTKVSIEGTLMRVAPVPSSAVTLTYIYVPFPGDMGTDGTKTLDALSPDAAAYGGIPVDFHEGVLYFMLWKAAEYDDKQAAMSPVQYRQGYESLLKDIRKQLRRKSGRGLHRGRVGYPDRRGPTSRNDTYPNLSR
jgi:hypothetical protein